MSRFRFNFGAPSISRIYCEKCGEETLHKEFGICNHCGTKHRQDWSNPSSYALSTQSASRAHSEWKNIRIKVECEIRLKKLSIPEISRKHKCSIPLVYKVLKELKTREQAARAASQRL